MSQQLINLNKDLVKLRNKGYNIQIKAGYLIVNDVPYLNSNREIKLGTLISKLALAGDNTMKPDTHVVFFCGEYPCNKNGTEIEQIRHTSKQQNLGEGIEVQHSFSNKPSGGYNDYYEKMVRYIEIISSPPKSIDDTATAKTFNIVESEEEDSVFHYLDTNSSRAEITNISNKLKDQKIGIIGLGGTGSYVLDLVSKTHVKEIHLFDGDVFVQHNAFRSPGAASKEKLKQKQLKCEYAKEVYSKMHKNIYSHSEFLTAENVNQLDELDFVFICIDKGDIKKRIFKQLEDNDVPFIDVGIGVEIVEDKLIGIVRTTLSITTNRDHIPKRISLSDRDDDDYSNNIQIAELNALNASMAVIKWKKLFGFYNDQENECNSSFTIDLNMLLNDDHET